MSEEDNLGQQSAEKSDGNKGHAKRRWPILNTPEWVTALATVAAAIAAIVAVAVSYETYLVARDTGDLKRAVGTISTLATQTKRQADGLDRQFGQLKREADAADKQVEATTTGNGLTRIGNRPWLGASGFQADPPTTAGAPLKVSLTITNAGKTPAQTKGFLGASSTLPSLPKSPTYIGLANEISSNVVVPGQSIAIAFENSPLSALDLSDINSGKRFFYVYGIAIYTEIGGHENHITHMCFMWVARIGRYGSCPNYNDAN